MKLFAVSIFDQAAGIYHAPIFVPAVGLAERWFRDECNNPQADMFKNAADFSCWLVGFFDNDTAAFETETPRLLMRGSDAQRKPS